MGVGAAASSGPLIAAILGGSAIGAGGGIAGGFLSQPGQSQGEQVAVHLDPNLNPALQGTISDALQLIGRGNFGNEPSPIEQIVGRIMAMPIDNKLKRRALASIMDIREGRDPQRPAELTGVLGRLGITNADLTSTIEQSIAFDERQDRLREEFQPILETTVRNRAQAAQQASQLLADASGFSQFGTPQTPFQQATLDRITRGIDDQEEQFLLQANLGGFQPGAGIERFQRARTDAPFTALEQAIAASMGLTAGLGGGLQLAQHSAGQSANLALGAAGVSAGQAQAANALRSQENIAGASGLAQGIAGAAGSLGTGIANAGIYNAFGPGTNTNTGFNPNTSSNPYYSQSTGITVPQDYQFNPR